MIFLYIYLGKFIKYDLIRFTCHLASRQW